MTNVQVFWTIEEVLYLSPEQLDICQMKADGKTILEIYLKYQIEEQAQLSAICYTIRGLRWTPHSEKGGNFPYLSPMDTYICKKQIEENCLDMD